MIVSIVILNWNGYKNTSECVKASLKVKKKGFGIKIIVVDNNSSDGSGEKIKNEFPEITIIKNEKNLGFSGGNNIGIKNAVENKSEYIFIINNDILLEDKSVIELIKTSVTRKCLLVCPKIYFYPGFEFHKTRYKPSELGKVIWYAGGKIDWKNVLPSHIGVDEVDVGQFNIERETEFATGAAMFIHYKLFEKLGLFDQRYFLYYEDLDFSIRAIKVNEKIFYCPKAIAWHKNAGSSFSGSGLQDYYIVRNRLLLGLQYAPIKSKLALLKESLSLLIKGRSWQRKAVLDFYRNNLGKGSYE